MNNKNGYFIHVDGCGEIIDSGGTCPRCNFNPAREDTVFIEGILPSLQDKSVFKKLHNAREIAQLSHSLAIIETMETSREILAQSLKNTVLYRYFLAASLIDPIRKIKETISNQIFALTNNPATKDS
jgi:hypothetical protein